MDWTVIIFIVVDPWAPMISIFRGTLDMPDSSDLVSNVPLPSLMLVGEGKSLMIKKPTSWCAIDGSM